MKATEVLARPLGSLMAENDRIVASPEAVNEWRLGSEGREMLVLYGLPLLEECRMFPHIQEEPDAQTEGPEGVAYGLGLWAHYEIVISPSSGEVSGVSLDADSSDVFVNSSVAKYIEMMWRWYRLFEIVEPLRNGLEQYDVMDDFLAFAYGLDPAVETAERSLWRGFIQGW